MSIIANKCVNVYRLNVTEQLESILVYLSQFDISIEFGFIQVFQFRFGFPWETWRPIVKRRKSRGDFRPHACDISSAKKLRCSRSRGRRGGIPRSHRRCRERSDDSLARLPSESSMSRKPLSTSLLDVETNTRVISISYRIGIVVKR